jgi:hypothetical protein
VIARRTPSEQSVSPLQSRFEASSSYQELVKRLRDKSEEFGASSAAQPEPAPRS